MRSTSKKAVAFLLICSFLFIAGCEDNIDDGINDNPHQPDDYNVERTVLTLGLFGTLLLYEELVHEVIAFNLENPYYKIELVNYLEEANGDWEAAELRRSVDMITGNAPDIIINSSIRDLNPDFMADLYAFIDSDPELNRTDFFPNVLRAYESPVGTLPFVGNSFSILTMLTMRDTAENIIPLTFNSIIRQVEETDAQHVFGKSVTRENFLFDSIIYSGNNFIDLDLNRAYLDSEEFINLLEITARLPSSWDIQEMFSESNRTVDIFLSEYEKLRNGEQLLYSYTMQQPVSFREYLAFFGDIVAVGIPTNAGGQHAIKTGGITEVGIYAGSQNQDAAWSFLRRLLMFDSVAFNFELPLRIDKFDALIAEMMNPNIVDGEEQPIPAQNFPNTFLYTMTEEEAVQIREIIDTATLHWSYDHDIMRNIYDVSDAFFIGTRTAEDTARIMQNRVQTVLNERG